MPKFWNFKVNNTRDAPDDVALRIEGDIVDDGDVWLYDWFGIPCASPNAFRDEMDEYRGRNITVWIDSYGGSVFAAAGMYNVLMEHRKTAGLETVVDAKAMSAATIPYMAGKARKISPVGIIMIHNPLTEASGYASELRKTADVLDVVKASIINAYRQATNLEAKQISQMMDDETYMSANTAVKNGFSTEILYADNPAPGIDNMALRRICALNSPLPAVRRATELLNGSEKEKIKLMIELI